MSKIYCSKCIHSYAKYDDEYGGIDWLCYKIKHKKTIDDAIEYREWEEPTNCEDNNRNNDCKFFEKIKPKKKWWKK